MELLEGTMPETKDSDPISSRLQRIAAIAEAHPDEPLNPLAHFIDEAWLFAAFRRTRKDGAPGVDGQTAQDYVRELPDNLRSLLDRAKSGTYWAPPVRRAEIPKGDERVIDPPAEVAVVGRGGLVAGDADGHAVEVQDQATLAVAAIGGPQALAGQPKHGLVEHGPVGLGGQRTQQTGQRRLRGRGHLQRAQSPMTAAGDPQRRIIGLALGVGQIAPAMGEQTDHNAHLVGQRVRDLPGIPRIGESFPQKAEGAGSFQEIADQQQSGVAALVGFPGFDDHGPVERRTEQFYAFTRGVRLLPCIFGLDTSDYKGKGPHAILLSRARDE
nr:hypothetical protein [Thiohalorhabdus denitrificans]